MKNLVGFFEVSEDGKEAINANEFKELCELADNFAGVEIGTSLKRIITNEKDKSKVSAKVDYDTYVVATFK